MRLRKEREQKIKDEAREAKAAEQSSAVQYVKRKKANAAAHAQARVDRICLYDAINKQDVVAVRRMAKRPEIVSAPNVGHPQELTPVHMAIEHRNVDIVEVLLNANADVNAKDKLGNTALMRAIVDGFLDPVPSILQAVSGVRNRRTQERLLHARNADGETPLHAAAARGYVDVVKALLERGVDPNSVTPEGYSALAVACMAKQKEGVEEADVQATVRFLYRSGARLAIPEGRMSVEQFLEEHNPEVTVS